MCKALKDNHIKQALLLSSLARTLVLRLSRNCSTVPSVQYSITMYMPEPLTNISITFTTNGLSSSSDRKKASHRNFWPNQRPNSFPVSKQSVRSPQ